MLKRIKVDANISYPKLALFKTLSTNHHDKNGYGNNLLTVNPLINWEKYFFSTKKKKDKRKRYLTSIIRNCKDVWKMFTNVSNDCNIDNIF